MNELVNVGWLALFTLGSLYMIKEMWRYNPEHEVTDETK